MYMCIVLPCNPGTKGVLCQIHGEPVGSNEHPSACQAAQGLCTLHILFTKPRRALTAVSACSDNSLQSLRGAAQLFASSDRLDKAAGLLDEITKAEPSDDSAWQNLVSSPFCHLACGVKAGHVICASARGKHCCPLRGPEHVDVRQVSSPEHMLDPHLASCALGEAHVGLSSSKASTAALCGSSAA